MSELLPCPFCGNAPYTEFSDVWQRTYAQCPSPIGFVGPEVAHGTVGPMTVEAWNRRSTPAASPTAEDYERTIAALEKIERWFGEFPSTGEKHEDGTPVSYGFSFGSNGERDFMRGVARDALSAIARQRAEG